MKLVEIGQSSRVATLDCAQKLFCLVSQLFKVGADRKVSGHHKPPSELRPASAGSGRKEIRNELWNACLRWTQSSPRTGGRPETPSESIAKNAVRCPPGGWYISTGVPAAVSYKFP